MKPQCLTVKTMVSCRLLLKIHGPNPRYSSFTIPVPTRVGLARVSARLVSGWFTIVSQTFRPIAQQHSNMLKHFSERKFMFGCQFPITRTHHNYHPCLGRMFSNLRRVPGWVSVSEKSTTWGIDESIYREYVCNVCNVWGFQENKSKIIYRKS